MALKDFITKGNAQMAGHITVGGYLAGPSNLVIDPAGVGDDTGTVEIKGSLQVNGTTTTVNSTTLDVADLNITVASGAANAGAADGAGLTVDGASATLTYSSTGDKFVFNKPLDVTGVVTATGGNSTEWNTAYGYGNHASAGYLTSFTETNDLSTAVTWANVPDVNITQSSVTQHQTALSVTESQISDLGSYLTSFTETDPIVGAVTGLVKADGSGNISAAVAGTDYLVTEVDTLDSVTGRGATTTNDISVNTLASTIATGTAPFTVASTTMVSNLNADKLDDKELTDIIAEATALAIALGQNMAQTFKNYQSGSVGTSPTTVYTVAGGTTSIVIGLNLANRTASQITASAQLGTTYIVKDAPIPSGGALSVLDGKIIAEAADTIIVTSNTASSCDVILSVLEQT